jgi:hypothetical protein
MVFTEFSETTQNKILRKSVKQFSSSCGRTRKQTDQQWIESNSISQFVVPKIEVVDHIRAYWSPCVGSAIDNDGSSYLK